jgi:hypothetical protein
MSGLGLRARTKWGSIVLLIHPAVSTLRASILVDTADPVLIKSAPHYEIISKLPVNSDGKI